MGSSNMFQQTVRVVLAVSLFTTQLLPGAPAPSGNLGVEVLMQKAQSLEARGREDLAAQVWQQVLVANPDQPNALAHLARWAKHTGQNEQAASFSERLHKVDPSFAQTQVENVVDPAAKSKSRLDEAARLSGAQRFADAMTIYREVFGATPPAGMWAVTYYETLAGTPGGLEPALAGLKRMATSYPNVPDYDLAIGRLMTYSPATRLAGVTRLSSTDASTTLALKAKSAWRQALVWEKANPAYAASAQLYLSKYSDPELEAATAAMRTHESAKAVAARPGDKEVQLGYGSLKASAFEEAKKHFHDGLKENEDNERAHEGLGFVAMKEGRFEEAVQEFEHAKANAGKPEVRAALGEARFWKTMQAAGKSMEAQEWKSAAELYQAALVQRPQSSEALSGLGGALLAAQEPVKAVTYLEKLVSQQPSNESAWCNLLKASVEAHGAKSALQVIASVPTGTTAKLSERLEWKAIQSRVYQEAGDTEQAQSLFREVISTDTKDLSAATQLELANLSLKFNQPLQASTYAARAVELAPKNVPAREALLSAFVIAHRQNDAQRVFDSMPKSALEQASRHVQFQQSLASLKQMNGDLQGARLILEGLAKNRERVPKAERADLMLQLADLDAKLGDFENGLAILNDLSTAEPDNAMVWRSRILLLNTMKRSGEIAGVFPQAPQVVAKSLRQDGDVVSVLASAYATTGRRDYAIRLLEIFNLQASTRSEAKIPQELQLGWLLLDAPDSSAHLYRLLDEINGEPTLDADSRRQLTDLWATWILRSAEASRKAGDAARALALLEQGSKAYPANSKLQSAYAGNLLAAGETKRALNVYANWGLADAQPDDFAGAIGAALAQRDSRTAEAWINSALTRWPSNPRLLSLAGDLSQSRGDTKHARAYWKEALAEKQAQPSLSASRLETEELAKNSPGGLRTLLVGAGSDPRTLAQSDLSQLDGSSVGAGNSFTETPVGVRLSNYRPSAAADYQPAAPVSYEPVASMAPYVGSSDRSSLLPRSRQPLLALAAAKPEVSLADSLQDKLASVDSRNTPYISSNMSVWGRGGQAGFSRLLIQQEEIEASTTIANTLRASLLLKPTYLTGGTADGSGNALFGQQTKPGSFGSQNESGVAGELELSSQSIGARIGSTPRGFLVNSWVGGFRLQPWNGPITLLLERDNVKETLLAYSGAVDPKSGQIWGGVMSNSASLQAHWGDSNSGIYTSGGYQALDGKNVANNTAINGNFGTWWKVANYSAGSLTVGMNFSAMHYDRNLRYFTFGQGGYFSPQQYYLFNLPVRWNGTHGRLQYVLGGGVGLQHFTEEASDYYPTLASLQGQQNLRYPALTSTGLNFSFDGRLSYQLAPHWMLGTFATVNNSRDYTASSAGLFVRYTFEERPLTFATEASSIPNWRGQDPFRF